MPNFLKNIDIQFISLVKKAANKRHIIFKSAEQEPPETKPFKIMKYDSSREMVYGIVYAPDEIDAQGDFTTKDEIKKAAFQFMKNLHALNVDKQHSFKPDGGAFVAESWLVKEKDPVFPQEKEGSWAVGIHVESEELKKEIESGEISGLSMAGTADKVIQKSENDGDAEKSLFDRFVNFFKTQIKKENTEEGNDMDEKKVMELIGSEVKKAFEAMPKATTEESLAKIIKAAVEESNKPLLERIEKIEKASAGSAQGNAPMTADEEKACVEAGQRIAKMMNGSKE